MGSENTLFFWKSQNGLGFVIYVSGFVSNEFLCWEVSFFLCLTFYFCIPWVNKLLVTCEKQIPPTKTAKRESYWNRRVSNKSLPKHRFWKQGRVLDQLHWKQVVPFTLSAATFWVRFHLLWDLFSKTVSLHVITNNCYISERALENLLVNVVLEVQIVYLVFISLFDAKEFPHFTFCLQKW